MYCLQTHSLADSWSGTLEAVATNPFMGPAIAVPSTIIGIFLMLFTQQTMAYIVDQTNLYASHVGPIGVRYQSVEEFSAFLGFMVLMSLVHLPSLSVHFQLQEDCRENFKKQIL